MVVLYHLRNLQRQHHGCWGTEGVGERIEEYFSHQKGKAVRQLFACHRFQEQVVNESVVHDQDPDLQVFLKVIRQRNLAVQNRTEPMEGRTIRFKYSDGSSKMCTFGDDESVVVRQEPENGEEGKQKRIVGPEKTALCRRD